MKEPIPEVWQGLRVVDSAAMRALDEAATRQYGIPSAHLMENAGKAVAAECAAFMAARGVPVEKSRVVVCCGRGANGGDGLVVARLLVEAGASISIFLCPPKSDARYPDLVSSNLEKVKAAGIPVIPAGAESGLSKALAECDLAIDALLGTGANGKPAGAIHHMIREMTLAKKPVVAIDVPSGLHPDTGYHSGAFVTAELTLALGLPKRGLVAPHAKTQVGVLKVLDIGYPPALLKGKK